MARNPLGNGNRWWAPLLVGVICSGVITTPQLAHAQQIINPSPALSATDVDPGSPISASFQALNGVTVRPETVKVIVDGRDVTNQSVITPDFFSYRPTQPLSAGEHTVLLEFTNSQNQPKRVTWSFTVSTPVSAEIESMAHNAANDPLAAGQTLLITVKGTPGSQVTVFLIQDGEQVQNLQAQEITSGTYIVNVLVEAKDTTREGIVVARLEKGGQVRFATTDQPVRLIEGATTAQTLTTVELDESPETATDPLTPQVTNYNDGDVIEGRSGFTIQGTTAPNASVQVLVTANNSIGGLVRTERTLFDRSISANSQGAFEFSLNPSVAVPNTTYSIELTATANGETRSTQFQLIQGQ